MNNEKRTVHPLRGTAQTRNEAGECQCDWCRHWSPIIHNIEIQLDDETKRLLNEFVEHHCNMWMDLNVAESKLDGSWPGYELMKSFIPIQPKE